MCTFDRNYDCKKRKDTRRGRQRRHPPGAGDPAAHALRGGESDPVAGYPGGFAGTVPAGRGPAGHEFLHQHQHWQ